jgi:hypothetical protein
MPLQAHAGVPSILIQEESAMTSARALASVLFDRRRQARRAVLMILMVAGACTNTEPISEIPSIEGSWVTTSEQPLSTIITGLTITQQGTAISALMSYSGVQHTGTGTIGASGFTLTFGTAPGTTVDGTLDGDLLRVTLKLASGTSIPSTLRRR